MTTTAHPLDFDEQALNTYYTKRDALTALIEDAPFCTTCGNDGDCPDCDESQCTSWGCIDGCQDCRGCPECFTAHDPQHCPAIRALLFAEPNIAAIIARMDAEPYRCLGCDAPTDMDTSDPGYCAACCKEMDMGNPARLFINPNIARTA